MRDLKNGLFIYSAGDFPNYFKYRIWILADVSVPNRLKGLWRVHYCFYRQPYSRPGLKNYPSCICNSEAMWAISLIFIRLRDCFASFTTIYVTFFKAFRKVITCMAFSEYRDLYVLLRKHNLNLLGFWRSWSKNHSLNIYSITAYFPYGIYFVAW